MLNSKFTFYFWVITRKCLHAVMFKKHIIFLIPSIAATPLFILWLKVVFSACIQLDFALIGKFSQAWVGWPQRLDISAANILATSGYARCMTVSLWHHNVTEQLTAHLKTQLLNADCVHFSADTAFWYSTVSIEHQNLLQNQTRHWNMSLYRMGPLIPRGLCDILVPVDPLVVPGLGKGRTWCR